MEKTLAQGARLLLAGKRWLGQVTTIRQRFWRMFPRNDRVSGRNVWPRCGNHHSKDAEHALELANDSEFGLSAPFLPLTKHRPDIWRHVWNAVGVYQWLLCQRRASGLWWREKSGFGRELSHFGLHEFCNIQRCGKTGSDATYSALIYSQVFQTCGPGVESGSRHG